MKNILSLQTTIRFKLTTKRPNLKKRKNIIDHINFGLETVTHVVDVF